MYTSAGIADEQGGEPTAQNAWYDLIILVDQTFGLTHVLVLWHTCILLREEDTFEEEDTCIPYDLIILVDQKFGLTRVLVLRHTCFLLLTCILLLI
jgi:hypothetical protein